MSDFAAVIGADGSVRVLERSLPPRAPHIVRDGRLWACRGGLSPIGYGFDPCAALREWRLMHEHIFPEHGKSRQLTVHMGHTLTENSHVRTP